MDQPLVSVILPSYNHAPYLRQCLDSVIGQTFGDWELVLVDDRSGDESVEIARSYSDSRIRIFVNETNMGTYPTLNRALEFARGKWIAVLNSDDYWSPEKLQLQLSLLEKQPDAAFAYCLGSWVDERGDVTRVKTEVHDEQHADWPREEVQDLLPFLLHENRVLASSVIFRKGAVQFEPSLKYSGDWVALLRLAQLGPAVCVSRHCTHWRQHATNTYSQFAKVFLEEIRVREAILASEWPARALVRERLARCALALSSLYIISGDTKRASAAAKRASDFDPDSQTAKRRQLFRYLPLPLLRRRIWPGTEPGPFEDAYRSFALQALNLDPG